MSGQSIRLYLADGTVTGVRHAEVVGWTGQALACPRSRLVELTNWPEAKRPGVYLLFGEDEESGRPAVYVGEAENVLSRLQDHLVNKDFWTEIVLFSNKDENLTKAHVRFLESRLIEVARETQRYVVRNSTIPQSPSLPRGDRDAMGDFVENIRKLLGVLGHKVLEPFRAITPEAREAARSELRPQPDLGEIPSLRGTAVILSVKGLLANGVLVDDGLLVLQGSKAASKVMDSLSGSYRRLRSELLERRILSQVGSETSFCEDYLFSSPSAAAAIVVGYSINGRDAWKLKSGVSISAMEAAIAKSQG